MGEFLRGPIIGRGSGDSARKLLEGVCGFRRSRGEDEKHKERAHNDQQRDRHEDHDGQKTGEYRDAHAWFAFSHCPLR